MQVGEEEEGGDMIAPLYEVHWLYVVFFVPFPSLTGSSQGGKVAFSRGQQHSCDSVFSVEFN